MTTKEYMSQVCRLEQKIKQLKLRSEEFERLSYSVPGPSYGEKIGSNPNRNTDAPFVKWLIRKDEVDRKIQSLEEEVASLKATILAAIDGLENEDYKNILIMRYLDTLTWEDIAEKLYCSEKTVRRWHNIAINQINLKEGEGYVVK